MKISVFGLGYVGCVGVGCMAKSGHEVIGVDVAQSKVNQINKGRPTIVEEGIEELIIDGFNESRISATTDAFLAVMTTDVSFIAVGTPSTHSGKLNLDYLFGTAAQIGSALANKTTFHFVVIRSTVFPGTNQRYGELLEKYSGKKRFVDFDVISNPEFLREGSAVKDYFNPPLTVIGSSFEKSISIMRDLYAEINAPLEIVDIEVAEIIKYVNNAFHALKVTFANEVGSICKFLGIDSREVMRTFCLDTKLNLSPYYLKPGFSYGGSCLPKDLKALSSIAHDGYLDVPVLMNIGKSNEVHKQRVFDQILKMRVNNIGIIGISFKEGTDDLRYSPIIDIIEGLIGKGYKVSIFDQNVSVSRLLGTNKLFIDQHIPHLVDLLKIEPKQLFEDSELIILNQKNNPANELIQSYPEKKYFDLVGLNLSNISNYQGICW
jgi:GDP-mannose 6-dehydrogenase